MENLHWFSLETLYFLAVVTVPLSTIVEPKQLISLMSYETLERQISKHLGISNISYLADLLSFRDLLDEARDYHLMPERRALLKTFKTRSRCCTDIVGVIYAVGGLTSSGGWSQRSLVLMFCDCH